MVLLIGIKEEEEEANDPVGSATLEMALLRGVEKEGFLCASSSSLRGFDVRMDEDD